MTSAHATVHELKAHARCSRNCRFNGPTKTHHDRLLKIEQDSTEVIDLFELAVTWGELDYSDQMIIPPSAWLDFVQSHQWADRDQAERIVSLATDVAMGSMRVNRLSSPSVRAALGR